MTIPVHDPNGWPVCLTPLEVAQVLRLDGEPGDLCKIAKRWCLERGIPPVPSLKANVYPRSAVLRAIEGADLRTMDPKAIAADDANNAESNGECNSRCNPQGRKSRQKVTVR